MQRKFKALPHWPHFSETEVVTERKNEMMKKRMTNGMEQKSERIMKNAHCKLWRPINNKKVGQGGKKRGDN